MIPKIIHYCWFGRNEKPKLAEKCIRSWHKYCRGYQFIEWNEDNFPIDQYPYAKFCLEQKRYAFLSDFVRLVVVYENGGIYFDTDVELIRPLDHLLENDAFFGFETEEYVATGLGFGAAKGNLLLKEMIDDYADSFAQAKENYQFIPCPKLNTRIFLNHGLVQNGEMQNIAGALILPADYMNPYDDPTGRLNKTENTVSIHWYAKSWMSKRKILRSKLTKPLHRIFGKESLAWLKKKRKS